MIKRDTILKKIIEKANLMQIDLSSDTHFKNWIKSISGVDELSGASNINLLKIYILLSLGEYQRGLTTEDDLYRHRAVSAYVTPKETEKVKQKMMKMYIKPDYKEEPRFVQLVQKTKKLRKKLATKI